MKSLAASLALGFASLAGCGDDPVASTSTEKKAYCDLRPGTAQCTDLRKFNGPSLTSFQDLCTRLKTSSEDATGYLSGETCPVAEMLGGCQTVGSDGSLQTDWYYPSATVKTSEDVKLQCGAGTIFVPPG